MGTDDNFTSKLPNLLINYLPYFISRSRSLVVNCHDDFCRDHRNYHRSFIYHREDRRSEETRRKEDFSFFAFISFFSFHEVRWIHFGRLWGWEQLHLQRINDWTGIPWTYRSALSLGMWIDKEEQHSRHQIPHGCGSRERMPHFGL